jgi:hypothetical protein
LAHGAPVLAGHGPAILPAAAPYGHY